MKALRFMRNKLGGSNARTMNSKPLLRNNKKKSKDMRRM